MRSELHFTRKDSPYSMLAVRTKEARHQKKALTFMMRREEGSQHEGAVDDLWVKEVDETGHIT
jgi:hypothetical protein